MKPLYIGIIVLVLVIAFFAYRSRKAKQQAEADAALAANGVTPKGVSGSSSAAQIINSLFPFFQTGVMAIKK